MEYVLGPVLALLLGMKFTQWKVDSKKPTISHDEIVTMIEETNKKIDAKTVESNTQMSKQMLMVMTPVAKSITKLNEAVGIQ